MAAANNVAMTPSMPTTGESSLDYVICFNRRFDGSTLDDSKGDRGNIDYVWIELIESSEGYKHHPLYRYTQAGDLGLMAKSADKPWMGFFHELDAIPQSDKRNISVYVDVPESVPPPGAVSLLIPQCRIKTATP